MNKNLRLSTSQRRALVEAHPDFLYRSSTGYFFQASVFDSRCKTLAAAFNRCFEPFCVSMRETQIVVSHAAPVLGETRTSNSFDDAAIAAAYMKRIAMTGTRLD